MDDDLITSEGPLARPGRAWLLIPCLPLGLVCALIPFATLRSRGAPLWLAASAGLVVFPLVPFLWQALAERRRVPDGGTSAAPFNRFALRAAAVGLLVLLGALSGLGRARVGEALRGLVQRPGAGRAGLTAVSPHAGSAKPSGPARHELESFIPADASLVVALSDAAALQPLLNRVGPETDKKLTALEKCQISVAQTRVLMATREPGTRLLVVRAPGITDPRNLYCLVGFLGSDRLKLRFTKETPPVQFEVDGLAAQTLKFQAIDERTVLTAEGAWASGTPARLLPGDGSPAQGPLAAVLDRIDRGSRLWTAALFKTEKGPWDLALQARVDGTHIDLRSSSLPPSGESDRLELDLRIPMAFTAALPEIALRDGIQGLVSLLYAAGAAPRPDAGR